MYALFQSCFPIIDIWSRQAANTTSVSLCILHCAKRCIRHSPALECIALTEVSTKNWKQSWGSCLCGSEKTSQKRWHLRWPWKQRYALTWQERQAERKCELSQGGRSPPRCVPEKWKGALYKLLRQRNCYILPDSCFHSRPRLCLLGHLVFKLYSSAII